MEKNPQVSVLVFTCNRCKDLERCLNSLSKQTYRNFEIIVIDNGSTDRTGELLKKHPVKVICDETNKLSYLFNLGWHSTSRKIIAYVADDVEVEPYWLENIVDTFEKFDNVAAVGGPLISTSKQEMHLLYESGQRSKLLGILAKIYETVILENKLFEPGTLCESGAYSMGTGLPICLKIEKPIEVDLLTTSSMGVRRKVLEELDGFDENFCFNHADGDLFVRMKKRGYKLIFHPKVKARHHVMPGPSRYPYYIGRDTAWFFLKDIRPKSISGWIRFLVNIIFFNAYWFYKAIQAKDIKQLYGFFGFLSGGLQYLFKLRQG